MRTSSVTFAASAVGDGKTIRAHEQEMKTLRDFITKCFVAPDTDRNQISAVVYSVVLGKLDVIQTLGDTLKEHI